MGTGITREPAMEHSSYPWVQELENQCQILLRLSDALLGRHPKLRRRGGHSSPVKWLQQVLDQFCRFLSLPGRDQQQRLLPWKAALEERLDLLGQRRIPPSRLLLAFRSHCRKLSRWFPQLLAAEEISLLEPGIPWEAPDVLVGTLRRPSQLDICLMHGFYHVPACQIPKERLPIRYVAIYQSRALFGEDCGIRFYGQVKRCIMVRRWEIGEIPKSSDEPYYRLEVVRWEQLEDPIAVREVPFTHLFTNLFLLLNSKETPELYLKSEPEYRYYQSLRTAVQQGGGMPLRFPGGTVRLKNGQLRLYRGLRAVAAYPVEDYHRTPAAIFTSMMKKVQK